METVNRIGNFGVCFSTDEILESPDFKTIYRATKRWLRNFAEDIESGVIYDKNARIMFYIRRLWCYRTAEGVAARFLLHNCTGGDDEIITVGSALLRDGCVDLFDNEN